MRAAAVWAAIGLAGAWSGSAGALTLASSAITVDTPDGAVTVASRVEDNVGGDFARWLFSYELGGSFEPSPGQSNGASGMQLFFGGIVEDVADQTAPPGWLLDCCFSFPPFGAGFDLPNANGYGGGPNGSVLLSFSVPAGTGFTDESQGSFATSYVGGAPFSFVILEDTVSGRGPIVPVPEPGSLTLLALGLGGIARRRRGVRREIRPVHREPRAGGCLG
jgi:hypothetical protein